MDTSLPPNALASDGGRQETAIEQIRNALHGLRYGNVVVTVHDGRVVQIDRTEKQRLIPPGAAARW